MGCEEILEMAQRWYDVHGRAEVPSKTDFDDDLDVWLGSTLRTDQNALLVFVLVLLTFDLTDHARAYLAAGELERLIASGNSEVLRRLATVCAHSEQMADLLGMVWSSDAMSEEARDLLARYGVD